MSHSNCLCHVFYYFLCRDLYDAYIIHKRWMHTRWNFGHTHAFNVPTWHSFPFKYSLSKHLTVSKDIHYSECHCFRSHERLTATVRMHTHEKMRTIETQIAQSKNYDQKITTLQRCFLVNTNNTFSANWRGHRARGKDRERENVYKNLHSIVFAHLHR